MTIRKELLDELLDGRDPSTVLSQDGLLGELKQALLNRLMAAEFDHHLAQEQATGLGKKSPQRLQPQAGADRCRAR